MSNLNFGNNNMLTAPVFTNLNQLGFVLQMLYVLVVLALGVIFGLVLHLLFDLILPGFFTNCGFNWDVILIVATLLFLMWIIGSIAGVDWLQ